MAGLALQTGATIRGNYTPLTPAAAQSPTGSTIGQAAYGISGTGVADGRAVAGYGSVITGAIALAALVYLYWSLPR